MTPAPFRFLRFGLAGITVAILVGVLFLVTQETSIYFTRSEDKARAQAVELFACIVRQQGYEDLRFEGPFRVEDRADVYAFEWRLRDSPRSTVSIVVSYLPYDIDYTVSETLFFGRRHPTPTCV